MLTKKKQAAVGLRFAPVILILLLAGCGQSGPDALIEGKRFLDQGRFDGATRKLETATSLMPADALAWGYLGLAYHQGGDAGKAVEAYARALSCDPNLPEIRFNLGCLCMEQQRWADAGRQFQAAALLDKNSALVWRCLGESQLRLGDSSQAVNSLTRSLQLNPKSADAWNWLGLARTKQGRFQEAGQAFQSALQVQANHGPAILNLAVLSQQRLNSPSKAVDLYHQYLAFFPSAPNAADVRNLVEHLELKAAANHKPVGTTQAKEPSPEPQSVQQTSSASSAQTVRRANITSATPPVQPVPNKREPRAIAVQVAPEPKVQPVVVKKSPAISSTSREPVITKVPKPGPRESLNQPESSASLEPLTREHSTVEKRGFFSKINPLNLFRKKARKPTPLPERETSSSVQSGDVSQSSEAAVSTTPVRVEISNAGRFKRYPYGAVGEPASGDRKAAIRQFKEAETSRRRGRVPEAMQAYAAAVQSDPSFYEAQFNLGLLNYESDELPQALSAFEAATILQPDSTAARYNFALVLKSANYPVDSANELLRLLSQDPNDARAHLALGNLFARQFGDKARAKEHYTRVLELEPGHPQASSIQFWIVENAL